MLERGPKSESLCCFAAPLIFTVLLRKDANRLLLSDTIDKLSDVVKYGKVNSSLDEDFTDLLLL